MHVTLATILSLLGVVSVLIVVAGIVGASFRVSRNTQTLVNYREAAQSWELKANSQEHEILELQQQVKDLQTASAEKDKQIVALQQQLSGLRDLVTSRAEITVLETRMSELLAMATENRTILREIRAGQHE